MQSTDASSHGFSAAVHLVAGHDPRIDQGHCHMDIEVQCWDRPVAMLIGGTIYELPAERIILFWAGHTHQMLHAIDGTSPTLCWVTMPLAWLQSLSLDQDFRHRLLRGGPLTAETLSQGRERMAEWAAFIESGQADSRIAQHELQALLLRLQRNGQAVTTTVESAAMPPLLVNTIAWLIEHFRDGFNAGDVGPLMGVHPNYLMQLFRRHTGQTLQQHINALRVTEAQRLLLTTEDSVTSIALACGFNSLNRFYVAFRAHTGTTPRAFRLQERPWEH